MRAIIDGASLRLNNMAGPIVVGATIDYKGQWKWVSSMALRFGRAHSFASAEAALRAGAKQIGITIIDQPL